MARFRWWFAVAIAVFGVVGTALELSSYELDPETGTYDLEPTELAYFAWMVASAGVGSAILIRLSGDRELWMESPSPLAVRLRNSYLLLSFAAFLLVFGVGSILINDALMRSPFEDTWMPLVAGMVAAVLGMLLPTLRPLWSIDEESEADGADPMRRRLGAVLMMLGLAVLVVSFLVGMDVTSRLYGTREWTEEPYGLYILAAHLVGLCAVVGGLVVYCGQTPFPHWRVDYRPPGAD
jgi:hypothetical protein